MKENSKENPSLWIKSFLSCHTLVTIAFPNFFSSESSKRMGTSDQPKCKLHQA
jgi:hypothetical protein